MGRITLEPYHVLATAPTRRRQEQEKSSIRREGVSTQNPFIQFLVTKQSIPNRRVRRTSTPLLDLWCRVAEARRSRKSERRGSVRSVLASRGPEPLTTQAPPHEQRVVSVGMSRYARRPSSTHRTAQTYHCVSA